jgi:hypothetical protein
LFADQVEDQTIVPERYGIHFPLQVAMLSVAELHTSIEKDSFVDML